MHTALSPRFCSRSIPNSYVLSLPPLQVMQLIHDAAMLLSQPALYDLKPVGDFTLREVSLASSGLQGTALEGVGLSMDNDQLASTISHAMLFNELLWGNQVVLFACMAVRGVTKANIFVTNVDGGDSGVYEPYTLDQSFIYGVGPFINAQAMANFDNTCGNLALHQYRYWVPTAGKTKAHWERMLHYNGLTLCRSSEVQTQILEAEFEFEYTSLEQIEDTLVFQLYKCPSGACAVGQHSCGDHRIYNIHQDAGRAAAVGARTYNWGDTDWQVKFLANIWDSANPGHESPSLADQASQSRQWRRLAQSMYATKTAHMIQSLSQQHRGTKPVTDVESDKGDDSDDDWDGFGAEFDDDGDDEPNSTDLDDDDCIDSEPAEHNLSWSLEMKQILQSLRDDLQGCSKKGATQISRKRHHDCVTRLKANGWWIRKPEKQVRAEPCNPHDIDPGVHYIKDVYVHLPNLTAPHEKLHCPRCCSNERCACCIECDWAASN